MQRSIGEIVIPITISILFTFLLWLLLGFIFKNYKKAGLLASLSLLLFFSYGHIYYLIEDFSVGGFIIGRHRYLTLVWGLLFIIGAHFIIKTHKNLHNLTVILNVVAVSLFVMSSVNIVRYEVKVMFTSSDNRTIKNLEANKMDLIKVDTLPDIYYIILDGYASSSTLEEIFGYDNHEFTNYLADKGFYVASESRVKFPPTRKSLASSLNMSYLEGINTFDVELLDNLIENNKVMQSLKAIGYQYIHISSPTTVTANNRYADVLIKGDFWENEFGTVLIETTMLNIFSTVIGKRARNRILLIFEKLKQVPSIKASTFTFAHIIMPHPPYIFNRNGEGVIPSLSLRDWEPKERYLDQLIFLNKKLKILVNEILSKSKNPPIIILQGDHGPNFENSSFEHRVRIFNAYHLPGVEKDVLYSSISPVNSFRLIFNLYFNANLDLLED